MVNLSSYQQIVWLASYPKSGNTWVRCFIDAYFLGEVDINDIVCSTNDDTAMRHQIGDGTDIAKLPVDIQMMTRPMALLRLVSAFMQNKFADVPLFVKTHAQNSIANGIELVPTSLTKKVVYLVRDPIKVLPSFAKHVGVDHNTAGEYMNDKYRTLHSDALRVADFIGSWDDHVTSYLNSDSHDVLVVKYEDLVADPVLWFTKILEHAGVEVNEDKVKYAVALTSKDKLRKQEETKGFGESSAHAKNEFFGKTNHSISDGLKYRINKRFGRVMKRLGYLHTGKVAA